MSNLFLIVLTYLAIFAAIIIAAIVFAAYTVGKNKVINQSYELFVADMKQRGKNFNRTMAFYAGFPLLFSLAYLVMQIVSRKFYPLIYLMIVFQIGYALVAYLNYPKTSQAYRRELKSLLAKYSAKQFKQLKLETVKLSAKYLSIHSLNMSISNLLMLAYQFYNRG